MEHEDPGCVWSGCDAANVRNTVFVEERSENDAGGVLAVACYVGGERDFEDVFMELIMTYTPDIQLIFSIIGMINHSQLVFFSTLCSLQAIEFIWSVQISIHLFCLTQIAKT